VTRAEWYWCLDHGTVESAESSCPPDRRLGPFATPAEAENWRETYRERNERWDREDAEWEGEEPES
jgi:hypothetical protein